MKEYIIELGDALYNEETGEAAFNPKVKGELVRCKDCKWCVEHYDTDGNAPYWVCKNWYGGTDADGYCHEAERKNCERNKDR